MYVHAHIYILGCQSPQILDLCLENREPEVTSFDTLACLAHVFVLLVQLFKVRSVAVWQPRRLHRAEQRPVSIIAAALHEEVGYP